MTDEIRCGHLFFSVKSEKTVGPMREGMKIFAVFDQKIDKLEIRRGRVCVEVAGMWHIVPEPKE